jgi:hypothetical protein
LTPLLSLLGLCLLFVTPCYLIGCLFSPWGQCRHCKDRPRKRRNCWHCDGTGKRPRIAWRVLAHLLRSWRASR